MFSFPPPSPSSLLKGPPGSQPSPHAQPPPHNPSNPMMGPHSQPFMSPRYPGGPRPSLRMPNQPPGGVPGSQPLLPNSLDPTRPQELWGRNETPTQLARGPRHAWDEHIAYSSSSPGNYVVSEVINPDPSSSTNPDPDPSSSTNPDPDPSSSTNPDPDPSSSTNPDPDPSSSTNPDPDPSSSTNPDPDPSSSTNPDPDPSSSTNPDPDPSSSTNPDPDPSSSTNPDPDPSSSTNPDPDPSSSTNPDPDPSSSTNPDPDPSSSTNPDPDPSSSTNPDPDPSSSTNPDPDPSSSTNPDPDPSSSTNPDPDPSSSTNPDPDPSSSTNPDPDPSSSTNPDPDPSSSTNPDPDPSSSTNPDPDPSSSTNPDPDPSSSTNPDPDPSSSTNPDPDPSSSTNPDPDPSSSTNPDPDPSSSTKVAEFPMGPGPDGPMGGMGAMEPHHMNGSLGDDGRYGRDGAAPHERIVRVWGHGWVAKGPFLSATQLGVQQVKGIVGESLTFPVEIPNLQPDTEINWRYGPVDPDSPIARIQNGEIKVFEERFKARLQLDNMSSSLRINGLQTADSGIYQVEEIGGNRFKKRFQLSVYNPVPEPQVLQIHSGEALANRSCTLLCFVGNASEVNVFWMRDGKPLNTTELDPWQETESDSVVFTCVASNPARNKSITVTPSDYCGKRNGNRDDAPRNHILISVIVLSVIGVLAVLSITLYLRRRKTAFEKEGRHYLVLKVLSGPEILAVSCTQKLQQRPLQAVERSVPQYYQLAPFPHYSVGFRIQCDSAILMDLAEESLDDQYIGCRNEMLKTVEETHLPSELNRDAEFQSAWKRAGKEMGERIQTKLNSEQATAIYVFTMNAVYKEFNRAVRTGGTNYTEFPFKALHFHLTDALKTLKSMKPKCYEVFRGVKNHTKVVGNIVRFGQFTSTSVNKSVAERFGKETLFTIRTCLGASIKKYSAYSNEKEVLIPPFEKFKVMEVNGTEIRLENIEDHESYFNCLGDSCECDRSDSVGSCIQLTGV
ncbi:UNVERIFIED_CONTAM: hypothetical protein FKN15_015202 [Acipenser sinensis]